MTVDVVPVVGTVTVAALHHAGVERGEVAGPLGQLVALLAQRYGLDPFLDHVQVITTNRTRKVYVTADGWRYVADRSGQLDGITFPDVSEGERGWRATVHVWRKGCAHPFEGRAGCGFGEGKPDPEALAMSRATRRALRNAFPAAITVPGEYVGYATDEDAGPLVESGAVLSRAPAPDSAIPPAAAQVPDSASPPAPPRVLDTAPERERQAAAHRLVGSLTEAERNAFLARHAVTFPEPWPEAALIDAARSAVAEGS